MNIAIAFVTGRQEPHLDWLIDGLEQQAEAGDRITLIVVDAISAWAEHRRSAEAIGYRAIPAIGRLIEIPPKPNPWQGPHRIIDREGWGMSNARNTALIACPLDVPYIVFLDDRARLGPKWLATVRAHAASSRSVLCGAYDKIESGPNDSTIKTQDHRLGLRPQGMINCGGQWLYGCCVGLSVAWALQVNGFEEGLDGLSMEDIIFGLNLQTAGYRMDYMPGAMVHQDRTGKNHSTKGGVYFARDKGKSPKDKSHAALERFGKRRRTEFTPNLTAMRERFAAGRIVYMEDWPMPDHHMRDWYDGELIRDTFTKP